MAVYKVIQDIEAEDKFLGPLTLKQFIFACITAVCLYVGFIFITRNLWYLAVPLLPVIGIGAFLAFPWGRDQPTEVWLLAKLRFLFKPRVRIWDQSGVQQFVTITAPKKEVIQYTNNLSQTEVRSRLKALAETIDSRGWAVKNSSLNLVSAASPMPSQAQFSDRLIDVSALPQDVSASDVTASDDIMDAVNNPLAQQLDHLIQESQATHRQAALDKMTQVREDPSKAPSIGTPPPNYWFVNTPDPSKLPAGANLMGQTAPVSDQDTSDPLVSGADPNNLSPEERALLDKIHKDHERITTSIKGHMRVIEPLSGEGKRHKKRHSHDDEKAVYSDPQQSSQPSTAPQDYSVPVTDTNAQNMTMSSNTNSPVTQPLDPAILELAINNDRDVASLAREANAKLNKQPDEVVVKLH